MKTVIITLCLLFPAVAQAQEPTKVYRLSQVGVMVGHGMDLGITQRCIGDGRCRELNPFLGRFNDPITFGATKMGIASLSLWAVGKIYTSEHPKWAIVANIAQATAYAYIAQHNARVARQTVSGGGSRP